MTAIVLSRRAREDFRRIWTYIALDDDRAADRQLLALDANVQRLRDFRVRIVAVVEAMRDLDRPF